MIARLVSPAALALLVLSTGAGCLAIAPADGALHCSTVGSKCPTSYYCAGDNTCWHLGKAPGTLSHDMSVASDGGMTSDLAGDDGGAPDDLAGQVVPMSCMMPSDCPAAPSWCLLVGCIGGQCALVAQSDGTELPASLQVAHDCQKLVCNASGQSRPIADTTDLPLDPTGGCNTPSCNGAAVTLTPTTVGTACTKIANGICNGKGGCGVCKPGALNCSSNTQLQTCSLDGSKWADSMTCQSCSGTTCVAPCTPAGYPQCNGANSISCVSGSTTTTGCGNGCCPTSGGCNAAATCTNGAPFNQSICDAASTSVLSCGACDGAGTTQACAVWCIGGACTACQPNTTRCCTDSGGGAGVETCDGSGNWPGTCNACTVGTGATATCSNGACGCSARTPCRNNINCGTINDACGAAVDCGDTCVDPKVCNDATHTCIRPKTTTATDTTCPHLSTSSCM